MLFIKSRKKYSGDKRGGMPPHTQSMERKEQRKILDNEFLGGGFSHFALP